MNANLRHALLIASLPVLLPNNIVAAEGGKKGEKGGTEAATRLQVFLDRAEFAPGKIDGHYGEFTLRALALYRQAHGAQAAPAPANAEGKKGETPDASDLDLASLDPLFLDYAVTEGDLRGIGNVPESVPEQAKEKALLYQNAAEAIAEKFHTDVDYLGELNPGKLKDVKVGDILRVPNVEPFELAAVRDLKPGSEVGPTAANELGEDAASAEDQESSGKKKKEAKEESSQSTKASVKIDTTTNMLSVYDGEKLLAAYPVTIGSQQTESPIGEWKVAGVAKMPNFRYDKAMLDKGERSSEFHMLPPGPNNPVGVVWIALNKKGIGLHGTNDPDSIGRSASHGCVRLANWDAVRLAAKVKTGVPVTIH